MAFPGMKGVGECRWRTLPGTGRRGDLTSPPPCLSSITHPPELFLDALPGPSPEFFVAADLVPPPGGVRGEAPPPTHPGALLMLARCWRFLRVLVPPARAVACCFPFLMLCVCVRVYTETY